MSIDEGPLNLNGTLKNESGRFFLIFPHHERCLCFTVNTTGGGQSNTIGANCLAALDDDALALTKALTPPIQTRSMRRRDDNNVEKNDAGCSKEDIENTDANTPARPIAVSTSNRGGVTRNTSATKDHDDLDSTPPPSRKRLFADIISSTKVDTTSSTNAIDATRDELVRMNVPYGGKFPKSGIEMALMVCNNDPRQAALFLHNAGKSDESAEEPSPTVIGNTIAPNVQSSSYMLKSLSNLQPSNNKYSYRLGKPAAKGTHYFDPTPGEAKLTVVEKSAHGLVARGLPHHDKFEGETTLDKRFKRAATLGDCPDAQLVRRQPDPNASNPGEQLGYLAKCPECDQEFNCLTTSSTSKSLHFMSAYFERHTVNCGKEVCGCHLELKELEALYEANYEGRHAHQTAARNHFGNCEVDSDVIFDILDEYTKMKNGMIDALTGKTDNEKDKLRKRYVVPSQHGLNGMMQELEVPCEERKTWNKKFPSKKCVQVNNWIKHRRSGRHFITEEIWEKMNSRGIDVTKVEVWN